MIPSKVIADYQEIPIDSIPSDRPISFSVFIYLRSNNHVLCLWKPGDILTPATLTKYRTRGLTTAWIHRLEIEAYQRFLKGEQGMSAEDVATVVAPEPLVANAKIAEETTPELAAEPTAEPSPATAEAPPAAPDPEPTEEMRLQEGELLKRVLESEVLKENEKKQIASTLSQTMIERVASAPTPEHQAQEMERAQRLIGSIIDRLGDRVHEDLKKLWDVARFDRDLQHGVQVATFSTLFALAFGRIDEQLLSDLALSGLVHDVGMCRMRPSVASLPQAGLSPADQTEIQDHVSTSVEVVRRHLPEASERVLEVIHQHQEHFDGSGYPRSLEGFDFDDIAQLVAMADLSETVRCGLWDGKTRTFREAFAFIEQMEQTKTFPHFFNPEVFRQVVGWTQREETPETLEQAAKRVAQETQRVVKNEAA